MSGMDKFLTQRQEFTDEIEISDHDAKVLYEETVMIAGELFTGDLGEDGVALEVRDQNGVVRKWNKMSMMDCVYSTLKAMRYGQ